MSKAMRDVGIFILAFLLAGAVVLFGKSRYDKKVIERHDQEQAVKANDSTEAALGTVSDSLRTVYVNQRVPYIVYRDRAVATYPKDTTVQNLVRSCNQLIVTCEERQAVDSARISNLQSEVRTLKDLKKQSSPRITAFITGGMDFIASQPLVQAGAELRFLGPLHLTGFVQAARKNNENDVETRGVVGLKFTFR